MSHSKAMAKIVGSKKLASIKLLHIERSLFPEEIKDSITGTVIVNRPIEYS